MSLQSFGIEDAAARSGRGVPPGAEGLVTCKTKKCRNLPVSGSRYCRPCQLKKEAGTFLPPNGYLN